MWVRGFEVGLGGNPREGIVDVVLGPHVCTPLGPDNIPIPSAAHPLAPQANSAMAGEKVDKETKRKTIGRQLASCDMLLSSLAGDTLPIRYFEEDI